MHMFRKMLPPSVIASNYTSNKFKPVTPVTAPCSSFQWINRLSFGMNSMLHIVCLRFGAGEIVHCLVFLFL